MELTRKQVIEILEKADSTVYKEPKTKTAYALEYAINSLKTDEAYQIMYEGGEIFTKDEVVNMLKDLKKEMALLKFVGKCQDVVQQKINELEEIENHDVKPIEATPQLSEADSEKIIKEVSTKPNYRRIQKLKEIVNKILLK